MSRRGLNLAPRLEVLEKSDYQLEFTTGEFQASSLPTKVLSPPLVPPGSEVTVTSQPQIKIKNKPSALKLVASSSSRVGTSIRRGIIICMATVGLFLGYFHVTHNMTLHRRETQAIVAVQPKSLKIVASDAGIKEADAKPMIQREPEPESVTFDVAAKAKNAPVALQARTFSFIAQPRDSFSASYVPASQIQSLGSNTHPQTDKLGLKPVPNSNGRFNSTHNGIEWQGSWELYNPRGNLDRAAEYSAYLKRNFKRNMDDSLIVRQQGRTALTQELPIAQPQANTLQRYGK